MGIVKEKLNRCLSGFLLRTARDSIRPHDYWCKSSHFLLRVLPPSKLSKDDRLVIEH